MNGFLRFIDNFLGDEPTSPNVVVLRRRVVNSDRENSLCSRIVVQRIPRPYWEENGWTRQDGSYTGKYITRYGQWHGSIIVSPSKRIEVFIHDPPTALEKHPHWACFNKRNGGWYFIHPTEPIKDISAAILNVEKTICEAYEN